MRKEKWNKYQNNYRKEHYKQVSAHLEPELIDAFKKKLKKNGITFSDFMRKVMIEYIDNE